MTGATTGRGRDRDYQGPALERRVSLRLSEAEFTAVVTAAQAARLTPSGYLAEVVLSAAIDAPSPAQDPVRQLLDALVEASGRVGGLAAGPLLEASACAADVVEPPTHGHDAEPGGGSPRRVTAALDRLDDATLAVLDHLRRRS